MDSSGLVEALRERDAEMFLRPSIFAEAADEIERLVQWEGRAVAFAVELDGWRHEAERLRAEVERLERWKADFRKVTITAVEESFDGCTGEKDGEAIEVDGGEWIGVPCEVWIRNNQEETSNG